MCRAACLLSLTPTHKQTHTPQLLGRWYQTGGRKRRHALMHSLQCAELNLHLIDQLDLIGRTRCVRAYVPVCLWGHDARG